MQCHSPVQPSHPGPGADGKLKCGPFTIHQVAGVVSGYGSTTLSCVFSPTETGAARLPIRISFRSPAQRKLVVPSIDVALSAVGRDVPIFLENSVLDFKCSMVSLNSEAGLSPVSIFINVHPLKNPKKTANISVAHSDVIPKSLPFESLFLSGRSHVPELSPGP